MSFLPDDLKMQSFPCPNCKQFISSEANVYKFCSTQITSDTRAFTLEKEVEEKRRINLNRHRNYLILGIGLLNLGIFSVIMPIIEINYSNNVNINCLTPIF